MSPRRSAGNAPIEGAGADDDPDAAERSSPDAADRNSAPTEFKGNSVIMEVSGRQEEIPNDYVWIFAGGEPPTAFLKKIGVGFGNQDLTSTGSKEAKEAKEAKQGALVQA